MIPLQMRCQRGAASCGALWLVVLLRPRPHPGPTRCSTCWPWSRSALLVHLVLGIVHVTSRRARAASRRGSTSATSSAPLLIVPGRRRVVVGGAHPRRHRPCCWSPCCWSRSCSCGSPTSGPAVPEPRRPRAGDRAGLRPGPRLRLRRLRPRGHGPLDVPAARPRPPRRRCPTLLSAVAAVVYIVATFALATNRRRLALLTVGDRAGRRARRGARPALLVPQDYPDATVWSDFGAGYGFVPLVLPFVGLWWLWRQGRRDGT